MTTEITVGGEGPAPGPPLTDIQPGLLLTSPGGTTYADAQAQLRTSAPAARGRHAAPRSGLLSGRWARFITFSGIGGFVFVLGLAIQIWMTGVLHISSIASYGVQAVVSVELNFLLNRWLTWRDRGTPFRTAFLRFNAQRVVTVTVNSLLYIGLISLGMNYLAANIVLTIAFTAVNFLIGDKLVFTAAKSRGAATGLAGVPMPTLPMPKITRLPPVSVVIPCRNNETTIRAAVQSLFDQTYPALVEVMLVGSPGDTTWSGLTEIDDPRLLMLELETPPGVRDANFKRDYGIRRAAGDLVALLDSDMVLPREWMTKAYEALDESRASCVTGGMKSIRNDYWGRYTDHTFVGAKTPRVGKSYLVTAENFGVSGKPPITANILFKKDLYESCPINPYWSHGSYEDYEWFWRLVKAGHAVRVCWELYGFHHHRQGLRALVKEYLRSSRGCAYFIRAHRDCPLAQRRRKQAFVLPAVAAAGLMAVAAGAVTGYAMVEAAAALGLVVAVACYQVVQARRLEAVGYAATGVTLGLVFTGGLVTNLIRANLDGGDRKAHATVPAAGLPGDPGAAITLVDIRLPEPSESEPSAPPPRRPGLSRLLLHPVTAICLLQVALSLSLIWSNTAFTDEADTLWMGRLVLANWLHGASWPSAYGQQSMPGSPLLYPPLGAVANSLGGLAGARVLSLVFMLGATVLLYLTGSRVLGKTAAVFAVAAWVVTEPVLRLAFATSIPMSVFLMALSAWVVVQSGHRRHHGELIAASALLLALANATAYVGLLVDPAVIAFAYFALRPVLGPRQAAHSSGWLTGAVALFLGVVLTVSHSWPGFVTTVFGPESGAAQGAMPVLTDVWVFGGLVLVLAAVGVVASGGRASTGLLAALAVAGLLVPATQLLRDSTDLLDNHLAWGIWLAAMAAGYGCSQLVGWLPDASRKLAVVFCALGLLYPAVAAWQSARGAFQGWSDSRSFVTAFGSAASQRGGLLFAAGQQHVAEYYDPQITNWSRWKGGDLPLDPAGGSLKAWTASYQTILKRGQFGTIALFYASRSSAPGVSLSQPASQFYQRLVSLGSFSQQEPGLGALTIALERACAASGGRTRRSPALTCAKLYRPVAVGPYDSAHNDGLYVIWQRVAS